MANDDDIEGFPPDDIQSQIDNIKKRGPGRPRKQAGNGTVAQGRPHDPGEQVKKRAGKNRPTIEPISRLRPTNFGLRSLNCFVEIDRRIRLGWTAPECARAIKEEFNEWADRDVASVRSSVENYIDTLPPASVAITSATSAHRKVMEKLSKGLNELEELERLYNLQMNRIEIDWAQEQKIKKLFATTGREVFVAMKLLNASAQLKMDMGLVQRNLGTMEVTGQLAADATERYGKDSVGKVLADPDSRRKVLGVAERIVALASKAGIDAISIGVMFSGNGNETKEQENKTIECTVTDPAADEEATP